MNRTLMLLIPVVILVAMGLILLQQMWSGPEEQMQPESVAGEQLPFANNAVPTPLSSNDLDEAIRREQMNRTQTAPQLPPLEGMPQTATATPPAATEGGVSAGAAGGDSSKSELSKLADASVAGQPAVKDSGAADELARQVAEGGEKAVPGAKTDQAQTAKQTTQSKPPQAQTAQTQAAQTQTAQTQAAQQSAAVAPPQEAKPLEKFVMTAMSLKANGSEMILTLTADKRFAYKSFTLVGPDRLVVDLTGEWEGVKVPGMPSNRLITKVRAGKFEGSHRIVLDLKAPLAGYETKRVDDHTVTVRLY